MTPEIVQNQLVWSERFLIRTVAFCSSPFVIGHGSHAQKPKKRGTLFFSQRGNFRFFFASVASRVLLSFTAGRQLHWKPPPVFHLRSQQTREEDTQHTHRKKHKARTWNPKFIFACSRFTRARSSLVAPPPIIVVAVPLHRPRLGSWLRLRFQCRPVAVPIASCSDREDVSAQLAPTITPPLRRRLLKELRSMRCLATGESSWLWFLTLSNFLSTG
ncbi:hypothetical protein NL676_007238 [Syzygium grande]|nr:hypothetical protein NL676_007238 [Syzygium grande]